MASYQRIYFLVLLTLVIALFCLFNVNFVTVLIQKNSTTTTTQHFTPNGNISFDFRLNESSVARQSRTGKVLNLTVIDEWEQRGLFVRGMAREAWNAYLRLAWGNDSVPSTDFGKYGNNSGHSIVAAMSTLWVMNMTDEFAQGRSWIRHRLNLSRVNHSLVAFDVIPTYIGSLLSCYALSNDSMFLYKAKEIELLLRPAFKSPTGLPYRFFNPATNRTSDNLNTISQMAHKQPELIYLSNIQNITELKAQINKIDIAFQNVNNSQGLYMDMMYAEKPKNKKDKVQKKSTLFSSGRNFYFNLINSHIQSGGRDMNALKKYQEAIDSIDKVGMFKTSSSGLYYVTSHSADSNEYNDIMEFSGCYLGAMLSLGANAMQSALSGKSQLYSSKQKQLEFSRIKRHWQLARQLTDTCHQAETKTQTGLAPSMFYFNDKYDANNDGGFYGLTAELAESYFVMWRMTKDVKYREYAWAMAQAISRHCRVDNDRGYSAIANVDVIPTKKTNYQEPLFLSATLKYLYLTFVNDTNVMSLDKWIFTSNGHPLPICGTNNYPLDKCNY